MPIRNRDDAAEVQTLIDGIFDAAPERRAAAIRELFVGTLDFNPADRRVSLDAARGVELPAEAVFIAHLEGVNVVYVALDAPANGRVRTAAVSEAARLIAGQLVDELLLVFTNVDASQLHLVYPDLSGPRATLRRMVVERDLPQRTAVQQISNIYWEYQETKSIRAALDRAFDVEPVTRDFFVQYKRVFDRLEQSVTGFADSEHEERRLFVQTLFNRLMFVYFLQRKGWLEFRSDKDYFKALWGRLQTESPRDGQLPPESAEEPVLRRTQQSGLPRCDGWDGVVDREGPLPERRPV